MKLSLVFFAVIAFFGLSAQELPDYFIENVELDTTQVRRNGSFFVDFDLSVDTQGFTTEVIIYLSDDLILSTGDFPIRTVNATIGSNRTGVSLSNQVETGTKNVLVVVNKDFTRRESNYSNNVASADMPLTIFEKSRGDLGVEDWELESPDVVAGEFVSSSLTVSDTLNSANGFTIGYYLSDDEIFDTDDFTLGIVENNFVSGPPGTVLEQQFQIPEATNSGTWYLLAYLDLDGFVFESDEANNLGVLEIFVNPRPNINFTVSSIEFGDEFERDEFVNFQFVVSETETDEFVGTSSALYLSRDSTFSTDDRFLVEDEFTFPENTETLNFRIPEDIDTGIYELLIVTDYELQTKESDETDNIGIHQIRVIPSPRPDLAFDEILFNSVLSSGQTYTNQLYSYSNLTGFSNSENFETAFYLSRDSTLDNDDVLLYNNPSDFVPSGLSIRNRFADFTLSTAIDSGEYLLLSFIDLINEVSEEDELNNDTIIAITIVNPDLTVGVFTSTETVSGAGLSVPVTVQVDNVSETNGYAAPSTLEIYLSTDEDPDEDDISLLEVSIGDLEAGFTSGELNSTVTFPNTIDAGDYFLLALADADSLLAENDEENNWSTIPISIELPDLEVKSPIINPSTITAGKSVTLEFRVDNNAQIPAPPSTVKIYLSEDETLEFDQDNFLTTVDIEALDADASSTDKVIEGVAMPEIEQGAYKVLFAVDADSLISESDETNNITTGDISLTNPDILPLNLDLSREVVGSGESTTIDFVFTNQGDGDIDGTFYTLTLAGSELEQDIFLLEGFVEGLESSATSNLIEQEIEVPSFIERGDYYVKVFADWSDSALESDETNNEDSILLEVTNPDLTLSGIIASPNIISVGFPTAIELDVENIGRVNAPSTTLSYVLSSDNIVDENDFFYSSVGVPPIDSLADFTVSAELTIPSFINPGEYFIIVDVDPGLVIPELDEENNRITVNITVNVPDLGILNEGLDLSVVGSSEAIEIESRVTNSSSDAKAPPSTLAYYLSEDAEIDALDRLAGFIEVESLELGATSTNKVLEFEVPADVEAGNYNVLFSADDFGAVNETDETNNIVSLPVQVTNPDLVPSNIVLSKSSLELSESFEVTVQVTNSGDSRAASGTLEYYLSTEETALNDSSIYLGENAHTALAVDEDVVLENQQVAIPSFLDPADYFLLVFVDPDSLIAETNEGNNIIASPVNLLFADLLTINQELDKETVPVGDTLVVSYNLKNDGDVTSNSSITSFFLAGADTTFLTSFNESEEPLVANGTASSKDIELVIPFSVAPGEYQLAIEVDTFDNTIESDEENNVSVLDVTITPIDLVAVSGVTIPAVIEPDSTNTSDQSFQIVDFGIEGTASIDAFRIQNEIPKALGVVNIYISEDESYDESDVRLVISGQNRIVAIPDELSFAVFGKANFPFNIPQGDYFALFQLDGDSLLNEADEVNNFVSAPISYGEAIKPDIVALEQQIIPSTLSTDKEVRLVHLMINDGAVRVRTYGNTIYLSDDEVLDAGDTFIDEQLIFSSNPGLDEFAAYDIEFTDPLPEGVSYFIGINDEPDLVTEQFEDNNSTASEFTFYSPLAIDFTPTCSNRLPEVILSGDQFDFVYEVENLGDGLPEDLGESIGDNFLSVEIYFSEDDVLSPDDEFLRSDFSEAVSPHEIASLVRTLRIPGDLTAGTYYIIVSVDVLDEYDESDETNNELALEISVEEPITPDLRIDFDNVSSSAAANTAFSAGVRISNLGGSNLDNVSVAFYLSEINLFSEDLEPLEVSTSTINVNAYQNNTSYFFEPVIPFDTDPGRYILFARVDDEQLIVESNEDNNLATTTIEVEEAVVADFTITNFTRIMSAFQGEIEDQFYQISYTVRNNGTKAEFVDVGIYFSLDEVFDDQDILLLEEENFFLQGDGDRRSRNPLFELPDLLAGDYFVFVVADHEDEVFELEDEDNVATIELTVFPPSQPDVSPEEGLFVDDTEIGLNGVIEIEQVINNLDRGGVDSVLVSFYLSTDPTVSGDDFLLSEFYSTQIAGFGSTTVDTNEVIPTSLSIGAYYLIAVLDENDLLDESDEANNETFIAITLTEEVQPDFIPSIDQLEATSFSANTLVNVEYSVFNNGEGSALESEVAFYLSKNDVVDASDIFVATESIGFLESGFTTFIDTDLLIPASADPGDYNLIISADPDNLVAEEDETNNLDLVAVEVLTPELADLTSAITSLPAVLNARELLEITHRTQNVGLGSAPESSIRVYLSEDEVVDATDQLIGNSQAEPLNSNESVFTSVDISIPDVTPGDFFIISVVDEEDAIEEEDEENNQFSIFRAIEGPIFPDLILTSLTLDDDAVNAGNDAMVTARIDNVGDNQSLETTVAFYLSADGLIDAGDVDLGTEVVDEIQSDGVAFVEASLTIPSNTIIGEYFILAEVNPDELLEEEDLTNNSNSVGIEVLERILADLEVTFASVQPTEIPAGQEGNLSISIFNFGGGSSAGFVTDVYLSPDQTLNGSDELLTSVSIDPILFGESTIAGANFTIDLNTAVGSYFLIIDVDSNNAVEETDETNNTFTIEVDVLESLKADLVPQLLTFDASSVNAGGSLGVNFEVLNQGEIASQATEIGVYFSSDNTLDGGDELITTLNASPLNADGSDAFSASVPIPLDEDPGDYFVIINVDDNNAETELDETNNVASAGIEVTEPIPGNLTITQVVASETTLSTGESLTVSVSISNTTSNAVLPYTTGLYLSDNQTLSNDDTLLDSESFGVLQGQGTSSATFNVTIDESLDPGDYFLIARVDDGQDVAETDETDNDEVVAITVEEALSIQAELPRLVVYPNPATDRVSISTADRDLTSLTIVDMSGKLVFEQAIKSNVADIDISRLEIGEYVLRLEKANGEVLKRRFVKQ